MGSHVSSNHLRRLVTVDSQPKSPYILTVKNKVKNISIRKKIDIILILCDTHTLN